MKKGEVPIPENFSVLTLRMDSLAKKRTAHNVCFSVWEVRDLFTGPLMEKVKVKKRSNGIKTNSTIYELQKYGHFGDKRTLVFLSIVASDH